MWGLGVGLVYWGYSGLFSLFLSFFSGFSVCFGVVCLNLADIYCYVPENQVN